MAFFVLTALQTLRFVFYFKSVLVANKHQFEGNRFFSYPRCKRYNLSFNLSRYSTQSSTRECGQTSDSGKDKKIVERIEDIANMPDNEQKQIFNVIDALIRDYKAKKAYS